MTTWTTVNLPWGPAPLELPPRPQEPFLRRDLCGGGKTWAEYNKEHYAKQGAIWAREGRTPGDRGLSQAAADEIEQNRLASSEVLARIYATPEIQAWQAECQRITVEREASYFSTKLEVGMLIELEGGRRLLVGDMGPDGCLGGCSPIELENSTIVIRYTKVELPEL